MPSKSELRRKWDNAGENVVVLHQFPRSRVSPNLSPFPIKFETFMRLMDIKYVNDFDQPLSSKGKSPWMTFNKKDMADSQLCIEHLIKELGKDPDAHLTDAEKAIAKGFQSILEDHFYFCLIMERWSFMKFQDFKSCFSPLPGPSFLVNLFLKRAKKNVIQQGKAQGIGRHSKEEIREMALKDFKALSDYLGDKPFMMGDQPSLIDCVLFAFSTQALTLPKEMNFYLEPIENEAKNIKDHFERMKEKYWPDWEDCIYKDEK